jgi:hypothetical protein
MMSQMHESKKPRFGARRTAAAGIAGLVALGGIGGLEYLGTKAQQVEYARHPDRIPDKDAIDFTVSSDANATLIATELTPEGKSASDLVVEIQNQTDENGLLQPGQHIRIERRLVDTNSEAYQLYGHPADVPEAPAVLE